MMNRKQKSAAVRLLLKQGGGSETEAATDGVQPVQRYQSGALKRNVSTGNGGLQDLGTQRDRQDVGYMERVGGLSGMGKEWGKGLANFGGEALTWLNPYTAPVRLGSLAYGWANQGLAGATNAIYDNWSPENMAAAQKRKAEFNPVGLLTKSDIETDSEGGTANPYNPLTQGISSMSRDFGNAHLKSRNAWRNTALFSDN